MQKFKKALKKLANSSLRASAKAPSKPAIAAKKATPVKKKTQSLPAKKASGKDAAKKAAPAKAAPAKTTKVAAKAAPAPAKGKVVAKGKEPKKDLKATAKKAAPAPKAVAPKATAKAAAPIKAAPKVAAKPEAPAKAVKAAAPEKAAKQAAPKVEAAPAPEKAPKAAKVKKTREPEIVQEPEPEEEVVLLDADGRRYCRVKDCDQGSTVDGYCRFHYLLFWKNIQNRKSILAEGKLERYIEELTARYPDKYLDMLKKDLRSEKEFLAAIQELEIDEAAVDNDYEDEAQNYLDEVRGMGSETGATERDDEF